MLRLIPPGLAAPDGSDAAIQQALEAVRTHLGMEVAYVSEFVGNLSVYRNVDAPGLEAMIKVGDSRSLDDVYCRHILAGRLPQLIADTADHPLALAMPITAAVPIGAHVSVPIRLQDGSAHGMFCCLSPRANHTLNQRDLDVMRAFADMIAHQVNLRVEAERASRIRRARVMRVIDSSAFTMAYQPILSFEPERVIGFEALCRFTDDTHRSPDLWFQEANEEGCGVELELRVLEHALDALSDLPEDVYLSLNASPEAAMDDRLRRLLENRPGQRVVLEITEHARVADYDALREALAPLRRAGVRVAIDDAGAGYASLQHIIQLKPDIIKLDIGLTRGVDGDASRRALTAALAYFAREIGASVTAEGIETAGELHALKALGVQNGQGYYLGRPAPLRGFAARLAEAG